jgi:hypothetical protein
MLYGGRALTEWVLEGGRPERAPFAYAARLRWHTFWFEHNWRTQAAQLHGLPLPQDFRTLSSSGSAAAAES